MLQVNEIVETISGEAGGFPQGSWCALVRLQGCNLRCRWCDTPQAQQTHNQVEDDPLCYPLTLNQIMQMVGDYHQVMITGGEPLLHQGIRPLIARLAVNGQSIQVETNGSFDIPTFPEHVMPRDLDSRLHWVIDRKGPSSGMLSKMLDLGVLIAQIEQRLGDVHFKWVVANEADLDNMVEEALIILEETTGWPAKTPASLIVSPAGANASMIPDIIDSIRGQYIDLLNYLTFSVQAHKHWQMP